MHSLLEGSCSTCKNKEHRATMWGRHQGHGKFRTSILPPLCCASLTADLSPPPSSLIRDKDQFSGEKFGCLGTFVDGSSVLLSQYNGNVSLSKRASSSLASRPVRGWVGNLLVSVGSFPQLVCRHSGWEVVVLHDVLEVKFWHHLKLKDRK